MRVGRHLRLRCSRHIHSYRRLRGGYVHGTPPAPQSFATALLSATARPDNGVVSEEATKLDNVEREFRASNAQLYPRLGDIAIQKFSKNKDGGYQEETVWAEIFNAGWRLPKPEPR